MTGFSHESLHTLWPIVTRRDSPASVLVGREPVIVKGKASANIQQEKLKNPTYPHAEFKQTSNGALTVIPKNGRVTVTDENDFEHYEPEDVPEGKGIPLYHNDFVTIGIGSQAVKYQIIAPGAKTELPRRIEVKKQGQRPIIKTDIAESAVLAVKYNKITKRHFDLLKRLSETMPAARILHEHLDDLIALKTRSFKTSLDDFCTDPKERASLNALLVRLALHPQKITRSADFDEKLDDIRDKVKEITRKDRVFEHFVGLNFPGLLIDKEVLYQ